MPTAASAARPDEESSQLPRIAAIFAIRFDQRVGYTIAWERSKPGLELSGAVEYKSLPSGLHNVREDLIYYVHDSCAGISAFQSAEASEAERSARFVSVGVLVPRGRGRFGGGWLHADKLREFATELLEQPDDFGALEKWWEQYQVTNAKKDASSSQDLAQEDENDEGDDDVAVAGMSESTVLAAPGLDAELSPSHPVLSIMNLLDLLGPLIFPIYRAALLRKRILFITKPPLLPSCNFVYNLSLLSSIPANLTPDLPASVPPRSNPIFSIGVHDIPLLDELSHSTDPATPAGWIACTSDELFATKTSLSDVRISLPSTTTTGNHPSSWPSITSTQHGAVKATQRDLRRYNALRRGLLHLQDRHARRRSHSHTSTQHTDDRTHLLSKPASNDHAADATPDLSAESSIIEPAPWAAVLYDSFMWWASAGARSSADFDVEAEQDRGLLAAAAEVWEEVSVDSEGRLEMALVAYFQRMTAGLLRGVGDMVDVREEEGEDDGDEGVGQGEAVKGEVVELDTEDLVGLGLDGWSVLDREFVGGLSKMYFEKDVVVKATSVEWCGVKVC